MEVMKSGVVIILVGCMRDCRIYRLQSSGSASKDSKRKPTSSMSSVAPTTSAPAFLASSALLPSAKTTTTSFFLGLPASCLRKHLPLSEFMLTLVASRGRRVNSYAAAVFPGASDRRTLTASVKGKLLINGAGRGRLDREDLDDEEAWRTEMRVRATREEDEQEACMEEGRKGELQK